MAIHSDKNEPVKIFYSHAHEDAHFRKQLDIHLIILQRQGFIVGWHDRDEAFLEVLTGLRKIIIGFVK